MAQCISSINEHHFGGSTCSHNGLAMASKLAGLLLRVRQHWFLSRPGEGGCTEHIALKGVGECKVPGLGCGLLLDVKACLQGVECWPTVPWRRSEMVSHWTCGDVTAGEDLWVNRAAESLRPSFGMNLFFPWSQFSHLDPSGT